MDINLVNVVAFVAVWTLLSIPFGLLVAQMFRSGHDNDEERKW